jgi:nitrate/nitrite transporter NarK
LIKEPQRFAFETPGKRKELLNKPTPNIARGVYLAMIDFFTNPTCRWCLIAGSFRFFGGYAIGFFMPSYFQNVYPDKKDEYGILNAFVVSVCGFLSSFGGGLIGDKYENVNYRTKAYICIFASVAGLPTIALTLLY